MCPCRLAFAVAALPLLALLLPAARSADEPKPLVIDGKDVIYWSLAFSPDGKILAIGTQDDGIELRAPKTGKKLATLETDESPEALVFSPDSQILASGSNDGSVRLWDVKTGKPKSVLQDKAGIIDTLAFSPDGQKLAASDFDKTVRIWDVMKEKVVVKFALESEWATVVMFTPDGTKLVIGTAEETVHIARAASGKLLSTLPAPSGFVNAVWEASGRTHWVGAMTITPDGKEIVVAGRGGKIRRWNIATGTSEVTALNHHMGFRSLTFSPDRRLLAGGDRKGAMTVWDVATGERLLRVEDRLGKQELAFSPDGKTLACCGDHTVIFGGADTSVARTVQLYPINLPAKK